MRNLHFHPHTEAGWGGVGVLALPASLESTVSPYSSAKPRRNHKKPNSQDFPGGTVVKNLPATGDMGLVPGSGRFCMPWGSYAHVPQLPKTAGPRAHAVQ